MQIKDVMTTNVVTVTASTSVKHAARLMSEKHVSGLPVVNDEGRLVGIVTEGDPFRLEAEQELIRGKESS